MSGPVDNVFADVALKALRAELHGAQELNRQLAAVLWALRDELQLWRQVGQVAASAQRRREPSRRIIVPNGTRAIVRS